MKRAAGLLRTCDAAAQGTKDAVGAAGGRDIVATALSDGQLVLVAVVAPHQRPVLLHAFRKTAAKVPQSEIDIARARWSDFQARMQADPREPPRAAGRDAP